MYRGQQRVKKQISVQSIEDGKEVFNCRLYNFIINT